MCWFRKWPSPAGQQGCKGDIMAVHQCVEPVVRVQHFSRLQYVAHLLSSVQCPGFVTWSYHTLWRHTVEPEGLLSVLYEPRLWYWLHTSVPHTLHLISHCYYFLKVFKPIGEDPRTLTQWFLNVEEEAISWSLNANSDQIEQDKAATIIWHNKKKTLMGHELRKLLQKSLWVFLIHLQGNI